MFKNFYDDRSFVDFFGNLGSSVEKEIFRSLNSNTELVDSGWKIEIAVPGFTKKDVEIKIESGILKIKGEVEEGELSKIKKPFNYSYNIPRSIKVKKIDAKIEAGILTVNIIKEKVEDDIDIKIS